MGHIRLVTAEVSWLSLLGDVGRTSVSLRARHGRAYGSGRTTWKISCMHILEMAFELVLANESVAATVLTP